jgi:hypothetical protein
MPSQALQIIFEAKGAATKEHERIQPNGQN